MAQNVWLHGLGILVVCVLHPAMTAAQQPLLSLMPLPATVQSGTGNESPGQVSKARGEAIILGGGSTTEEREPSQS